MPSSAFPEPLRVPVFPSSTPEIGCIGNAFDRCPHVHAQRVRSFHVWLDAVQSLGVGVISLDHLKNPGLAQAVERLPHDPWAPLFACVVEDATRLMKLIAFCDRIGLQLVILPSEAQKLRYLVGRGLIRRAAARLGGKVSSALHLPLEVRAALRAILAERIQAPALFDAEPPVRHLEGIARAAGMSRTTLWKRSRAVGVQVAEMSRVWVTTQAAVHLAVEAPTLETLAWRAGFAGHSGLSRMLTEMFGLCTDDVRRISPQEALKWCDDQWEDRTVR